MLQRVLHCHNPQHMLRKDTKCLETLAGRFRQVYRSARRDSGQNRNKSLYSIAVRLYERLMKRFSDFAYSQMGGMGVPGDVPMPIPQ